MRQFKFVFCTSILTLFAACSEQPAEQSIETPLPEVSSSVFAEADGVQTADAIPAESMRSDIRPEVGGLNAAVVS